LLRVLIFKELCGDSCSHGSGPVSTKHCDLGNIDTEGERDRGMEGQRDRGTEGCVCVCGDQYRPGTIPLLGEEDKKGTVSQI
jgi:hypothetical protein